MIEQWIKETKKKCPPDMLGMILFHNGIMRATAKNCGGVQCHAGREPRRMPGKADIHYRKLVWCPQIFILF